MPSSKPNGTRKARTKAPTRKVSDQIGIIAGDEEPFTTIPNWLTLATVGHTKITVKDAADGEPSERHVLAPGKPCSVCVRLYCCFKMHLNSDRAKLGDIDVWASKAAIAEMMSMGKETSLDPHLNHLRDYFGLIDWETVQGAKGTWHNVYKVYTKARDGYDGIMSLEEFYVARRPDIKARRDANAAVQRAKRATAAAKKAEAATSDNVTGEAGSVPSPQGGTDRTPPQGMSRPPLEGSTRTPLQGRRTNLGLGPELDESEEPSLPVPAQPPGDRDTDQVQEDPFSGEDQPQGSGHQQFAADLLRRVLDEVRDEPGRKLPDDGQLGYLTSKIVRLLDEGRDPDRLERIVGGSVRTATDIADVLSWRVDQAEQKCPTLPDELREHLAFPAPAPAPEQRRPSDEPATCVQHPPYPAMGCPMCDAEQQYADQLVTTPAEPPMTAAEARAAIRRVTTSSGARWDERLGRTKPVKEGSLTAATAGEPS